jgi:hypothetical protein
LPVQRYSVAQLQQEWSDAFVLLHAEREEHTTPWGSTQAFNYCHFRKRPANQA